MTDVQLARYIFKKNLEEIKACRGRATELITLYVPPGRQISDVLNYLRNEYAQSSNIKSRTTRKNVMWAIESLMNKVKMYKEPPPNGVVFFVGTKAVGADQSEPVSFVIEPPEPINTYMYRCDSFFYTEPLEEMLLEKDLYGLIVIDRAEATIGFLRGKRITVVKNKQSLVPSKHGRGGQSQHRFERLIEQAAHEFYVKVADICAEAFLPQLNNLKGILVGGPGATKEYFINEGYLHHELMKKVVRPLFDTGYTDEYGLKELVEKASEVLADMELMKEKKIVQRFLNEVRKPNGGLAVYGEKEVRESLENGYLDTILISEANQKI
ncbi:MAG: peptide chain release factor aRF-1, partial [Thermoplasmata archaeon]